MNKKKETPPQTTHVYVHGGVLLSEFHTKRAMSHCVVLSGTIVANSKDTRGLCVVEIGAFEHNQKLRLIGRRYIRVRHRIRAIERRALSMSPKQFE